MIIGHKRIRESLGKAVEQQKVGHAYLFSGPEGIGKMTIAMEFAKTLQHTRINTDLRAPLALNTDKHRYDCKICKDIENGVHPDVVIVNAQQDSKEIKIEQIRQLRRSLGFTSHSAPYKIAIIDYAERMNQESANAFLKTLEEPQGRTVLIIITRDSRLLLPTIVSRCQTVNFLPISIQEIEYFLSRINADKYADSRGNHPRLSALSSAPISVQEIARLSYGCPGRAIQIFQNQSELKEQQSQLGNFIKSDLSFRFKYIESVHKDSIKVSRLLNNWLILLRDVLLSHCECPDLIIHKSKKDFLAAIAGHYPIQNLIKTIGAVSQIKFLIENTNVNTRLALERLAIEI